MRERVEREGREGRNRKWEVGSTRYKSKKKVKCSSAGVQKVPNVAIGRKWMQLVAIDRKWLQMVVNCGKGSQMFAIGRKRSQLVAASCN